MTNCKNTSDQRNIEIINQFYSELNGNNIEAAMRIIDSNIVRREFEDSPNGSVIQGYVEMRNNMLNGRSTWAEGTCQPVEFFSKGNKFVVDVHVKVRVKNETKWIDAHVADAFAIQDGKITEFHSYMTMQKAFEWAGIPDNNHI